MALPLFLPCAAGVESLLADEVKRVLPDLPVNAARGGVSLEGGPADVMVLNLECRLPQRVLIEVAEGAYRDENDLYELARSVDWSQWITPQHTLRVDTTAQRCPLKSLNFAALRIKDGVCDTMRDAFGERPSVDVRQPDLPLMLHVGPERASLYIDSSGEPLFKRGWREDKGDAPLKETLAAAMLAAAGWRGTPEAGGALHDPCCGSGTIAIEAAQIACGIAPGLKRRFAFERLLPFANAEMRAQWQRLKSHATSRIHASAVPIVASDVSFRMVDFARRNAQRAGVEAAISFHGGDALERPAPVLPPDLPGTLMMNPPYGERIDVGGKAARPSAEDRETPDDFFPRLAAHWKRAYTQHPAGWTAYVLSPDMKLPGLMRLKESRRVPMWNGPIECRLFRFDLVSGPMR
ncbi:THUMP domain-containing class I SAM-dependent RNA methyltransferase [Piscinibacter sp.]|uniref:THUMP domain-containing class I SAM-dependent RNA methyltransferase n=1 Tax=Piscinibacter sp. TaxID=1903157 RepID=UPI002CC1A875|nr:THUMP domain-containing protein [Albitalea sp.]HUG26597.1 THUMP domain-containing protein [Albitalea sp.]